MNSALSHISAVFSEMKSTLSRTIIGQDDMLEKLIITIFSGGHALIEWAPGLGKTRTIRTLARLFSLDHKRISFTPDLLPSDLIGAEIFRPGKGEFDIRRWPIFTNILLADEINRTPPKVQSALLEAMEERNVTIGNDTIALPMPFFVFATQNPLEYEGTYPLPEAQLDRFFMKITLWSPRPEDEERILREPPNTAINALMNAEEIMEMQAYIQEHIRIEDSLCAYIVRILNAFRVLTERDAFFEGDWPLLSYAASTRAGIALIRGSKVRAVMQWRDFVLPEDIKALAPDIIWHRIGLSYEAMSEGIKKREIIERVLDSVNILSH